MSNDDPKKFLMSGYTGFVPRARGEMGVGYPLLTNKALCEFTNESERLRRVKDLPVVVERPEIKIVDTKPIYMKNSGQVPHYTGHVPGKVNCILCLEKVEGYSKPGYPVNNRVLRRAMS